jgi:hypothetical protein
MVDYYITYENNSYGDGPVKRPPTPGDWRIKSIAPVSPISRYNTPSIAIIWENDQTR